MEVYRFKRDARKKALDKIAGNAVVSFSRKNMPDLERVISDTLDNLAANLLLSEKVRDAVTEYAKAQVGLSVAEAVIEGLEIQIGDLFS